MKWKFKSSNDFSGYNFEYDDCNRLTGSVFGSGESLNGYRDYFSENAEYDSNGNVVHLQRRGLVDNMHGGFGMVDNLSMTYNGNQLVSVRDDAPQLSYAGGTDFNGVRYQEYPLTYNEAGSLTSDAGRNIANIDYDLLNNPIRIQFTNGNVTKYIYSATGEKLRVVYQTAVPNISVAIGSTRELTPSEVLYTDSIDYLLGGALTLRNGRIDKYQFDEGYCQAEAYSSTMDTFNFYYFDRDHLGNIRQVIKADRIIDHVVQIVDYYPFGAEFCDGPTVSGVQSRKYNGKEFDNMHGLNTYDYGARQYNPVIARWDRIDPLCEKYYNVSPYAYCMNNPMIFVDLDGRKPHNWIFRKDQMNDPRDYDIYNNRSRWDDRVINIFAHGVKTYQYPNTPTTKEYMSVALQISDTGTMTPQVFYSNNTYHINSLAAKIRSCDENFSDHSNGDPIIVLHSCATANYAREISSKDAFRNTVIIAPNANLHVRGGKKGQESINNVYVKGTGKTIIGEWQVYKNGKEVLDPNGNPITYPSNAQPGSVGFNYGF